ncbi:MAG: DUF3500 domain-containing protein, partial [Alphaproteobacteria bacterium]|nr:DUF3500 domain-containing protein [Alphaproteobacteria bacterium]
AKIAGPTARAHAQARLATPRAQGLFGAWDKLFAEPFRGLTTDGRTLANLFEPRDDGAPAAAIAQAAQALLAQLDVHMRAHMQFPVNSDMWRRWQNTELYAEQHGLRLEETSENIRAAVMNVLRVSMSAQGYDLARNVMRLNRFLGDLTGGPHVLGEWNYNFCLFGEPSSSGPWGWQFFGHHLVLNCFLLGKQMVLTPAFWGAEPCLADHGPHAGLHLFQDEERGGLALMHSFDHTQQTRAVVAHSMMGGDLPEGRRHFADNLHLGGAYQDNRIVPYEGLRADAMSAAQRRDLLSLAEKYIACLPEGPRAARMTEIERHFSETHFCWIGGTGEKDPFYYRIQSPVIFIEFDHHAGVFLTNAEPQKFHVHTIVRTPNGNDYGIDLLRQHYRSAAHYKHD